MDYLFENKCTIDQKIMTESIRSNRKTFTVLSGIPLVITGLGIASILSRAAIQFYLDLPMLLRWSIFFLLFLRIATTPRRTAKRVIKDFKRIYQVESVECTTQVGDSILYTLQGSEPCEYEFDCITKVISAKNCYLLCFKKRVLADVDNRGREHYVTKKGNLILTRDNFTKGDFEGFKAHLRSKCPGVKIPK